MANRMTKHIFSLFIISACTLGASGCADEDSVPSKASAPATQPASSGAGSSVSRAKIFGSTPEMLSESDLVVIGRPLSQKFEKDIPKSDMEFALTKFKIEDIVTQSTSTKTPTTITVRQFGGASQPPETPLLDAKQHYMLFLVEAELSDKPDHYYVTGVSAGIYSSKVAGSGTSRLAAPQESNNTQSKDAPGTLAAPDETFTQVEPDPIDDVDRSLTVPEVVRAAPAR